MTSILDVLNTRFPDGAFMALTPNGAKAAAQTLMSVRLEPPFSDGGEGHVSAMCLEKGTDVCFRAVSTRPDGLGLVVVQGEGALNVFLWPIRKKV